ncbi:MAG TPA: alanine dehydrogenase [Candidatus Tenderia electrophaga]|uniref:Alanine dehydrogenase n=1 Tax=Candidatus Tenderia electrophaga TaxID=1748243 RepID=A0A832J942_9GAMM|nr:alanine dehydrogenase [Candidatus Tenderia electrophaga]
MKIGVPKEIKDHEYRVGVTPAGAKALIEAGHEVLVQTLAGDAIGFHDEMYQAVGAQIAATANDVYQCPMVVKVKEPQTSEFALMHEGQILFTYLHLAPDPEQTRQLLAQKVIGIAYETVTDQDGRLPLLVPMSEVAGRIAVQAGAFGLQMINGGRGVLLGGVAGVPRGKVVVIGGGVVGTEAAKMALGLGADVTILDSSLTRLRQLDDLFGPALKTRFSEAHALQELVPDADLVIGAVLLPGHAAPKLVSRERVKSMATGAVIVDVAIDQGGCFETSKPTSHSNPMYIDEGVVHYCVTNMPGACARTATMALTNATLPYVLLLADSGKQALKQNMGLMNGLNVYQGQVTNQAVANDLGYDYVAAETLF